MKKLMKNKKMILVSVLMVFMVLILFWRSVRTASGNAVVTDPVSYTYYADMLERAYHQYEMARDQLLTMSNLYNERIKELNELKKNYYRVKGTLRQLDKLKSSLTKDPRASFDKWITGSAKKPLSKLEGLFSDAYSDDVYRNYDYLKKTVFKDKPETDKPKINPELKKKFKNNKRKYRQAVGQLKIRAAVEKSCEIASAETVNGTHGYQKEKNNQLNKLAKNAASSTNLKESAEITNALLCQILETMNTMLFLQAATFDAYLSPQISGQTRKELKKEIIRLNIKRKKILSNPDFFELGDV
jgi:hypothetical protein